MSDAQHTIEVNAGTGLVKRTTTIAIVDGAKNLVVALFNMKGRPRPVAGRFKDWQDWEEEIARQRREAEKAIKLDPEDGEVVKVGEMLSAEYGDASFTPMRLDVLPMRYRDEGVYIVSYVPAEHVFVTHAIVGERMPDGNVKSIAPIKFAQPIPVLEGHELRFGVRVGPPELPPAPLPAINGEVEQCGMQAQHRVRAGVEGIDSYNRLFRCMLAEGHDGPHRFEFQRDIQKEDGDLDDREIDDEPSS